MSEEKNVLTGTVKWFDGEKGYGFITVDDTDYFMHYSSINLPKGRKYLDKNDTVEFEPGKNDKGLLATNVTPGTHIRYDPKSFEKRRTVCK